MAQKKISSALTIALALAGVAACNGDKDNPPPQTPADQTTITGATTPEQSSQYAQPSSQGTASPATGTAGSSGTMGAGGASDQGNVPRTYGTTGPSSSPMTGTPGTSPSAPSAGEGTSAADTSTLDDGQIVAVVQAADSGEIAQAREALRKAKDGRVKHFAQHMLTDHSAAETKLSGIDGKAGINPQSNATAEQLRTNGEEIMASLKSASGGDFDKAYIDAQVKEHTKVLDLLDNKLVPHAQNADLGKALREIRSKVAAHLKDAEEIQTALNK